MILRKNYIGTFYNDSDNLYLFKATDNKAFAAALNVKTEEPFVYVQKKGAYDAWLVRHFDEKNGHNWPVTVICVPSGEPFNTDFKPELIHKISTFPNEIYCITGLNGLSNAAGSSEYLMPDAYYCVEDIIKHRNKGLVPDEILDKLMETYADTSDNPKVDYVKGEVLHRMCEEINCEPVFRLNTNLVKSSHFIENSYLLDSTNDVIVQTILGGLQYRVGNQVELIRCGTSFAVSFSNYSFDWVCKNMDDILNAFKV